MNNLLVRDCGVGARDGVDVRVRDGLVVELGPGLRRGDEVELDARGGALVPGLHDHHLHLLALAADLSSVPCGPDHIAGADQLAAVLRAAAAAGAVRATGYHESVAGTLDRDRLDAIVPDRPVRVQHRSGAAWFLNSPALAEAGLLGCDDPAVERDATGRPTGRLVRGDHLMHRRARGPLPDLRPVGRLLAERGVTGVTDATPALEPRQLTALREAAGVAVPQRVLLLGAPLDDPSARGGAWKIVLEESAGLDLDVLVTAIVASHDAGRPVAMHAVTLAESVVATTALRLAGTTGGDRIEHGSLLTPSLDADLARLRVTVVTQPHFVTERGDDYLAGVDPADVGNLYRCRSLLDAGVGVAAGTDAPFGRPDPWAAVHAAVTRRTRHGQVVGADEAVSADRALELFLGEARSPAGPPRRVAVGAVADLCLLRGPLEAALAEPTCERVAATVVNGEVVHRGDDVG